MSMTDQPFAAGTEESVQPAQGVETRNDPTPESATEQTPESIGEPESPDSGLEAEPAPDDAEAEAGNTAEGDGGDPEQPEAPPPGVTEIEFQGKTYTVPAELKDAFLAQKDYTQKTQDVAEQRRAVEAGRAALEQDIQRRQALALEYGQMAAVDAQLQEFAGVDWAVAMAEDPEQAQVALAEYTQLRDARETIQQDISLKERQTAIEKQRASVARIEQARAELTREIPEYTPAYAQQLGQFAHHHGFTARELAQVNDDPRYVRILHLAKIGAKSLEQTRNAPKAKPRPVEPVPQVPGGGRSRPAHANPDSMSTDTWMRNREKQLAKRKAG
jgi:hypothetical protein